LLKDGQILACGTPNEVMTAELLQQVFAAPLLVTTHPHSGKPLITVSLTKRCFAR
jgi:iron complex transport system ATP-binding protein